MVSSSIRFLRSRLKEEGQLKLVYYLANLGDCRTLVIHPWSSQYISFTEESRLANGITPDLIRLSVGIEAFEDILDDFDQALKSVWSTSTRIRRSWAQVWLDSLLIRFLKNTTAAIARRDHQKATKDVARKILVSIYRELKRQKAHHGQRNELLERKIRRLQRTVDSSLQAK